jgi:hypothetical protein
MSELNEEKNSDRTIFGCRKYVDKLWWWTTEVRMHPARQKIASLKDTIKKNRGKNV